jgi:acyl carrier protein
MHLTSDVVVALVNDVISRLAPETPWVLASTRIHDLPISSLDMAEIFAALEQHTGCELDPAAAFAAERVGDLVHIRGSSGIRVHQSVG